MAGLLNGLYRDNGKKTEITPEGSGFQGLGFEGLGFQGLRFFGKS